MNEDYLQYLWRFQQLGNTQLTTTSGKDVSVLFQGHWNRNAGPDFLEAKLRIGKELWIGSVEIHLRSSDWRRHHHVHDPAYQNVILHVVYEDDEPLVNAAGQEVPTLIVERHLDSDHYDYYRHFIEHHSALACEKNLGEVDEFKRNNWLHRMAIERLERRTERVKALLERYHQDWNAVWWHMLCRSFGFGLNQIAYEQLAMTLNWKWLAKMVGNPQKIGDVLLCHSSWIELDKRLEPNQKPRENYQHFQRLHEVTPIAPSNWRRGKMKPANHPRVRLGQLTALIENGWLQWRKASMCEDLDELMQVLDVSIAVDHLTLQLEARETARIGRAARERIITNAVIPVVFYFGRLHGDQKLIDRMLDWQDRLKPEDNRIIRMWTQTGWKPRSMLETQGQLHLFEQYCSGKKCLSCLIGITLLNDHKNDPTNTRHL
ncbi:DUF2851 family protein [Sanyastnella coralliicola]|uniref:DUF2851 family protein n=1 Tax=Sanyastnella coralliicola TaxID=3069118 RepID=UPI0027B996B5|nr:DUF2851 family protein [Longitalea sp. SCSIO 12813]